MALDTLGNIASKVISYTILVWNLNLLISSTQGIVLGNRGAKVGGRGVETPPDFENLKKLITYVIMYRIFP